MIVIKSGLIEHILILQSNSSHSCISALRKYYKKFSLDQLEWFDDFPIVVVILFEF